jgi:hypothetical protein
MAHPGQAGLGLPAREGGSGCAEEMGAEAGGGEGPPKGQSFGLAGDSAGSLVARKGKSQEVQGVSTMEIISGLTPPARLVLADDTADDAGSGGVGGAVVVGDARCGADGGACLEL